MRLIPPSNGYDSIDSSGTLQKLPARYDGSVAVQHSAIVEDWSRVSYGLKVYINTPPILDI